MAPWERIRGCRVLLGVVVETSEEFSSEGFSWNKENIRELLGGTGLQPIVGECNFFARFQH